MRNLKKLLAVVLTVVMIASMMVPALAANTYEDEALKLQAINVFAGGPEDLKLDEGVTRIQGLTFAIRAAGKDAEALAMDTAEVDAILADWTDADSIPAWGRAYAAYAIKNSITVGLSSTEKIFGALNPISGTSFLVFVMKSGMGYASVTTADVVDAAVTAGILTAGQAATFGAKEALIRDDAAGILYGAFTTGVNADGTKLIDAYIASGATTAEAAAEAGFIAALTMSVEAAKVDTLEVTFSRAVDTADINLAVTKNGAKVDAVAPVWSNGNKVATIKTTAKMTQGTYTVTATSASDENFQLTATTDVVSQYVKEIVILNDVALTNDASDEAYVYYDVMDQYGESLRSSTSIQWSCSTSHVDNRTKGLLTLKRPSSDTRSFTYGEKIYITGVYAKTGVNVTKEVAVGMKQALDSIEVAGFVKKGTSALLESLPAGFKGGTYYLVYTMKDQNGNALPAEGNYAIPIEKNEVTFISDAPLLIEKLGAEEKTFVINGDDYNGVIVVPGMDVAKGGEVNITAIANKTGNKTVINVVVGEAQILKSFNLLSPSGIVADGEEVEIPFEALDQNGNKITNFATLAKQADFNKLTLTASPGTLKLSEKDDGTAKLVYKDVPMNWNDARGLADEVDRIATLTTIVTGGVGSNLTLNISDKARPEAIKFVDLDTVYVKGGSDTVRLNSIDDEDDEDNACSFIFLDQYGREMDENDAGPFFEAAKSGIQNTASTEFDGYIFSIRATFKGQDNYFTIDKTEIKHNQDMTVSAEKLAAGNARSGFSLKFDIVKYKASGETFADHAKEVSPARNLELTIVDITAVKGFTIGDVKKFYVPTAATGKATGQLFGLVSSNPGEGQFLITEPVSGTKITIPEKYDHEITVKGYYNNQEVSIPDDYLTVTSEKLVFGNDGKVDETSPAALKWSDFYDVKTSNFLRKDASDTVKVTVKAGTEVIDTVSKAIAISDEEVSVATIEAKDEVSIAPTSTKIDVDAIKDKIKLKYKDQYGVELSGRTVTYKVSSIVPNADGYAENNFKVKGNDGSNIEIEGAERGDTFVLTVKVGDVTKDIKVTVGADKNAYMNSNNENAYLRDLIGGTNGLEVQRQAGLQ